MKNHKLLFFASFLFFLPFTGHSQSCLTCPSNIVIKAEPGKEGAIISLPQEIINATCGTITYTPASGSFFRIGSHSVIATSASGEKCSFTITVTDNESPVLSELTLSEDRIWPASNRMKKIRVNYTVTDNAQEVNSVLTVSSNNLDATRKDFEVIDNHVVRLSASRLPNGEPRIYLISVTSTDVAGNKMTRTTSIAVSETMVALKADGAIGKRN